MPTPGPGEVRIKIAAVALNHLDVWVRKGGPAFHLELPHRLGADIVGTVDDVGPGVGDLKHGSKALIQPGLSCGRCAACRASRRAGRSPDARIASHCPGQ